MAKSDYSVVILADSVTEQGDRLTTIEATYPRIIHAEMMTHRMFSRNAGSSRAIPSKKLRKQVWENPFIPRYIGKNQAGMQAKEELQGWRRWAFVKVWVAAAMFACFVSWCLEHLGGHKQLANRVLEPFQWYTAIFSATEWTNFFGLRCHPDAQPEIQVIATMIRDAREASVPKLLKPGEWHLPITPDIEKLAEEEKRPIEEICQIATGRVCRVSYETHLGKRDPNADVALYEKLVGDGHMSPLEHIATPSGDREFRGNFKGFTQLRKMIPHEADFSLREVA